MPSTSDRLAQQFSRQFGRAADANDPEYATWIRTALPQMIQSDRNAYAASKRRWGIADKIAWGAVAAPYAALAAPPLIGAFSGGAGAGAASAGAASAGTAGTAGAAAGGGILAHPLTGLAASGIFGAIQQRSQNKANDRATAAQMGLADRQLALETQRLADERTDQLAARGEDQKRWEADDAYRRSALDAENEDRAYNRAITDRREARRMSYQPYADRALQLVGRYLRF